MRSFLVVFLASLVALMSGCIPLPIPHDRALSPQFYGQVTDDSGSPIQGAVVRAVAGDGDVVVENENQPLATSQTDERGFYRVGVTERDSWYFLFFGAADGLCSGTLTVTHPSYEEQSFKVQRFSTAYPCNGFKVQQDIVLKRK